MPKEIKRNKPRHMSGKAVKRTTRVEQEDAAVAQEPIAMAEVATPAAPIAYQPRVQARPVRIPRTSVAAIQTNYDYVAKDLRRIGITAVSIFVVMGVLSVVLPMVAH
jgi:hypothetical protein